MHLMLIWCSQLKYGFRPHESASSSSSCMCRQGLTSAGQSQCSAPSVQEGRDKSLQNTLEWGENDGPYNQVKPESSHFPFREIRWERVTRFGGWGCNWEISLNCYRGAFTLEESQVVLVKSYPSPPTPPHPTPPPAFLSPPLSNKKTPPLHPSSLSPYWLLGWSYCAPASG